MGNIQWAHLRGVLRLELRKSLFGRRALPIYAIGLLPLIPVVMFVLVSTAMGIPDEFKGSGGAFLFFVAVYEFILRFVVYFGCVWVFMNLFRGEVIDRSLHYYFLTPIRREALVFGKYFAGWLSATIVFGGSTLVCFLIVYGYLDSGSASGAAPLPLLLQFVGVVALACLGYGAVFLVVGLFLRSLVVPALVIFLLESANPVLPTFMKKISVIFYLQGLRPLPPLDGPVRIISEPVSVWIAVPGFVLFTAATLVAAALRIRTMEIAYGNE
jgi:ABC-type transport system involved in multi-copper enzyme maturation permease subunit